MAEAPDLRGEQLLLRIMRATDVKQGYVNWLNDPQVNRFLEARFLQHTSESVREYVSARLDSPDEYLFGIMLAGGGNHIGNIKLGPVHRHHRSAEVGLMIGARDCWGQGHATEAIVLVTCFGLEALCLNKLHAGAYAANLGSIRAFEKAGWRREGLRRNQVVSGGLSTDLILLGISADDWRREPTE